jgi:hypothetical protein
MWGAISTKVKVREQQTPMKISAFGSFLFAFDLFTLAFLLSFAPL